MIGTVDSEFLGYFHIEIDLGSRQKKGQVITIPSNLLQDHKVHRLQIQSVTGPLPENLQGIDMFPIFTDKPGKYPDLSHPDNKINFDNGSNQLDQAKQALGIQQRPAKTSTRFHNDYERARDFIHGGRPITNPNTQHTDRSVDPSLERRQGGTMGY